MLAGATTAVTGASATCPTWPACDGLIVGLGLLWLTWHVRGDTVAEGVRRPIIAAVTLYPIQVAVGALAVGADTPVSVNRAHLVVAVAIFGALTVALARQLTHVSDDSAVRTPAFLTAMTLPMRRWLEALDPSPRSNRPPPVGRALRVSLRVWACVRCFRDVRGSISG